MVLRSGTDKGVIISFCHRCISLEYLWFYSHDPHSWVCLFSVRNKETTAARVSVRELSIVTKVISRVCGEMHD